jgi:hypothetical protein
LGYLPLNLKHSGERLWLVQRNTDVVAEIYLDLWDQVDQIVLCSNGSDEEHLQVLRLAASHVQQFVKHRDSPTMGGLMIAEYHNPGLTALDSARIMNFDLIPKAITALDRNTIVKELRPFNIPVIVAVHKMPTEAIKAAIFQVGIKGLRWRQLPDTRRFAFDYELPPIEFTVGVPNRFTFWKSEWRPSVDNLHIVPNYHPVMNDCEAVGMVNGDTAAYIGGGAIKCIFCPEAAQANTGKKSFGMDSWNHVKHPFRATGNRFQVTISSTRIRSAEGVEKLVQLLRAALGLDKKYVEINGGFRAPMKCAHNRLLELGRKSPYPQADYNRLGGHVARGSEEHCVWAYRTLKDEGVLDKAHVPAWFINEDWLGIYKGAEVRHGLF